MYKNRLTSYLVWRFILKQPRMRRLATRVLVRGGNEWIDLLGARIYINRHDEIGYLRARDHQNSAIVLRDEVPSLLRISALLSRCSTFVDCGANVGLFTASLLPIR